ncbi:hypothetical protein PRIPAC_70214 [Pristionchus pacificus]|uniref:Uncharacterized protein n=1 Tax=Pristionchus pacificus TaxID=54126 RepID=A0A2A6BGI4_PRIPA|nr:hypothetical protein PRIPAC_70214 [Pristionchus pacificus]|eukprot:PDM65000.1 hypothetical protein PRIPAC_53256 [Pristionchus pacificus]
MLNSPTGSNHSIDYFPFITIQILLGASLASRLKTIVSTQMALGEGVHVSVIISPSRSLPLHSIHFFLGERTTGEDVSAHVVFTIHFDIDVFALVIKPVGVDPTTAEILESPDHIDPLRSFANAVLQQESLGTLATLSWLQLEQLAKGEPVRVGPLHPAQPSLPPALLRQGVSAAEAARMAPLLIPDALSQEEIANSDGLRPIAPNSATSGDRFGLHEQSLEDWRIKKEEDKKARKIRRQYLTEEEVTSDEEEEEKEKEMEVEMGEETAELPLDVTPSSPPPSSTRTAREATSPLREDHTPRGSPPPPPPDAAAAVATPAATPAAAVPAAPAAVSTPAAAAAPAGPPPAALAAAAASPQQASSASSSPLRRSPRLRGSPPPPPPPASSSAASSPLRSTAPASRKRSASPLAVDDVTEDDEEAPVHSPRKARRLESIKRRAQGWMDVLSIYVSDPPKVSNIVKSVTSKVAVHTICSQWRSVAATMRHRYKAIVDASQVAVRVLNNNLLEQEDRYEEINDFLVKASMANDALKIIHNMMIQFSKKVYTEFEELDDDEDRVCDDFDEYEKMHLEFKETAAEVLPILKEFHQAALQLHY